MALFLGISFLLISCGNAGPVPKEGEAVTADGRAINLAEASEKIKEISTFVVSVKEIETLVKSIDELAKAIGKKIQNNDNTLATEANYNNSLLAGVFRITLDIIGKSGTLKVPQSINEQQDLTQKVGKVKSAADAFRTKLKEQNAALGAVSGAATDANATSAIDINGDGSKGGTELKALNASIAELLTAAQTFLSNAYKSFETPIKSNITKP